ncbi:exo-alpha-sialidase [Streptomyces sp. RPA4-5]|uniref:sialidase family protein n=1 Tax=Streptomyces TaxID=1883 RepID=UPI00143ECC6E|nr:MULTISPECIES: sialidase family protein [Streptomyces]MCX4637147.1 glycoside hydrolase [Streptomyces platensis]QIY54101.1 exo-alpha-sialidase [Streptomyces sp. RPA4-5]WJY36678.1 sialidase family protein [Streptomyces sp. P9-2B-2]
MSRSIRPMLTSFNGHSWTTPRELPFTIYPKEFGLTTFTDRNGHEVLFCTYIDPQTMQFSWASSDNGTQWHVGGTDPSLKAEGVVSARYTGNQLVSVCRSEPQTVDKLRWTKSTDGNHWTTPEPLGPDAGISLTEYGGHLVLSLRNNFGQTHHHRVYDGIEWSAPGTTIPSLPAVGVSIPGLIGFGSLLYCVIVNEKADGISYWTFDGEGWSGRQEALTSQWRVRSAPRLGVYHDHLVCTFNTRNTSRDGNHCLSWTQYDSGTKTWSPVQQGSRDFDGLGAAQLTYWHTRLYAFLTPLDLGKGSESPAGETVPGVVPQPPAS